MGDNTNANPSPQEIKARSEDICYACEGALWVDFFFDGFGYSIPEFGGAGGDSYRRQVTEKAKIVVPVTPAEATGPSIATDAGCIRGPSLLNPMMRLPETLKEELKGHQALFLLWYRSLYDQNAGDSDPAFSLFRREMKLLERTGGTAALRGEVKEFYDIWKSAAGKPVPGDVLNLFTKYVHDSIVEIDEVLADALTAATDALYWGPNLLRYRNTLEIEKQPEKDWLDDVKSAIIGAQKAWTGAQKASATYGQKVNEIGPSGYPSIAPPSSGL